MHHLQEPSSSSRGCWCLPFVAVDSVSIVTSGSFTIAHSTEATSGLDAWGKTTIAAARLGRPSTFGAYTTVAGVPGLVL